MRLSFSEVQVVKPVRKSGIGIRGERGGSEMVQNGDSSHTQSGSLNLRHAVYFPSSPLID